MTTSKNSPTAVAAKLTQPAAHGWTFLSNHAHALLLVARDPGMRMKDMASAIGITERAVQRIIDDLIRDQYLSVERCGRRNHYTIDAGRPLRHPIEAHHALADLLRLT